ncbi:tripartite tricarboxylate transporter substrate binding protein [Microbacteriaceae bacterium K1510]|nr:tripartite tricarboxylate transporter substrate binding protein [Microbacteriaceae bacterium K1510]
MISLVTRAAVLALVLSVVSSVASADDYPCKTVRILVPYAAGGPSDTGARLVSRPLSELLETNVIVENRGGAGGLSGTEYVAQAPADGCTLLLGAVGPLVYIPAERKVSYDPRVDFVPLGLIWQSPLVLVANPKFGFRTVSEYIAYVRSHPNTVSVASAGVGTNTHMASELFKREAGITLLHVPYRGTGAALPDLISGQVDSTISDVATMAPLLKDGRLIGLAVTAQDRSALLPNIPTMAESGLAGARTENWYGLLVKAGTAPALIARLKEAVTKAVATEEFRKALAVQGATVRDAGSEAFVELIDSETRRWLPIIRESGIKF